MHARAEGYRCCARMCSPQIHRSRHTLLLRRRPLNDRLTSIRFAFVETSACSLLLRLARVVPRTRIGLNGILLYRRPISILSSLLFFAYGILSRYINFMNRSNAFLCIFFIKGEEERNCIDVEFRFGNLHLLAQGGEWVERMFELEWRCFLSRASLLQLSRLIFTVRPIRANRNSFALTRT